MMRKCLVLIICSLVVLAAFAQNRWDIAQISDSLKKQADAVIREYSVLYERKSVDKYEERVHYVATILNKGGASTGVLLINYDDNSSVDDIEINLYDAQGELSQKVKKREIKDYAYNTSYTLLSDSRVKFYETNSNFYPITVEFSYTINYDGFVGVQPWLPQDKYDVSTEHAELTFQTPKSFDIEHKDLNYDFDFNQTEEEGIKTYYWEASSLKAKTSRAKSPDYLDVFPVVLINPGQIYYEGTAGDFSNWKSYGQWVYGLIQSRDELPEETVAQIKALTDTIPSIPEKTRAVYKYMQGKTRYVNIAYGIGGFQPLKAEDVDEKGYGDCKALSNYTRSLLKAIGIDAYYTEIGNGKNQKIKYPDFPSAHQTNHVILCVPNEPDTIWLECTSQKAPFGYVFGSNSDRYALLIKEDGGELAKTPVYPTDQNTRNSQITLELDENGNATANLKANFNNYLYEEISSLINRSKKDQKEKLLKSVTANSFDITSFSVEDHSLNQPQGLLEFSCKINRYAQKSGSRLFISPNFLLESYLPTNITNDREIDYVQNIGYTTQDSLIIDHPQTMKIEFLPDEFKVESDFGAFSINYKKLNDHQIQVSRKTIVNKGRYKPSELKEIDLLLHLISKQQKAKIILKNEV